MLIGFTLLAVLPFASAQPEVKSKKDEKPLPIAALKPRLVGPALTSGRIVGFAVDPHDRATTSSRWPRAACGRRPTPAPPGRRSSTTRARTRSAASPSTRRTRTSSGSAPARTTASAASATATASTSRIDGGKTWKNVGLKESEHIGKIVIDPRDSDIVYVAAQGPLWGPGGDRGLYKTTDGGKTWKKVLDISENTGVTDVVLDPRNPDVLDRRRLPAPPARLDAHRRRTRSAASTESTDGGKTWKKVTAGLPERRPRPHRPRHRADRSRHRLRHRRGGRQGGRHLPLAPTAARPGRSATRSTRRRSTTRTSSSIRTNKDRIYVDERAHPGLRRRRQDARAARRDATSTSTTTSSGSIPTDPNYYLVGCDGGIYESFDRGANWRLQGEPAGHAVLRRGRATTSGPFYNVYGGTQDNFTLGGPARTREQPRHHERRLVRHAGRRRLPLPGRSGGPEHRLRRVAVRRPRAASTGGPASACGIQPQPGAGEPPLRWNWDSPLIISPHTHTRLYFAANRLFRSDDRGDSWTAGQPAT